jgi:hypothetical protein
MQDFLIEVPHSPEEAACASEVKIFLNTGSHFLSHAYWGCLDGNHSAWLILAAEDKEEAKLVVPPQFRAQARIVGLNKFTIDSSGSLAPHHRSAA